MKTKSLGDRMKAYEEVSKTFLMKRMPVIIRLDGVAFHTLTRKMNRPYDEDMMKCMQNTMLTLCKEIHGCRVGYTQSDEISLLLTDYAQLNTEAWYANNLQKIVSVSAAKATRIFNNEMRNNFFDVTLKMQHGAEFDSRAFTLSKEEVNNYFLWRQQDATRNAIQSAGQSNFSQKQLHKVTCNMIQEMLFTEKGINFNDYPTAFKRGTCAIKVEEGRGWELDKEIPLFNKETEYIDKFL